MGKRVLRITRPQKVLFPDDGITKADLVEHYRAVARRALPELRGRPVMMERHPDGIAGRPLMQKNAPDYFPDWVPLAEVTKEGGTVTHVVCDDAPTLAYLAGQASITPHRWLSRIDKPDYPDRLIFDLDPSDAPRGSGEQSSKDPKDPRNPKDPKDPADMQAASFEEVRWTAHRTCELLAELGLPARLMTTGSRGLHVVVPLDRRDDFDAVREFARGAADLLAARYPDRLTTEARKENRGNRIYLDTLRNGYAQTAVAPYAVRAKPGAPVATPITADELDDPELRADRWTLATIGDRLTGDNPWPAAALRGRSLHAARQKLAKLK
ncbi:DNA polymerase domain-containing protein [Streptomyces zagrosensis]|uniref:Bifunctional non-homologous end joining protein LigD n=1 Tax=Streptomyces zagrosensis TaxID=1042984 RepID=A0A7W9Q5F3_9ACTN|nr:DNA primase small subunit domain-containing protein [Streptomyces zagrosensis]MBB5933979.1 bifunctional non-homologous end joining protein LigD [Streptomyces zagrosensis]